MKKGRLLFNGSRMRDGRADWVYIDKLVAYIVSTYAIVIGILALIPPYQGGIGYVSLNIFLGAMAITLGIIFFIFGRQLRYFKIYENGLILTQPPYFSLVIKDGFISFKDITKIEITSHRWNDNWRSPTIRIFDLHIIGKFFNIKVSGKYIPNKKYFEKYLTNRVEVVVDKEYRSPYPKYFPNYLRQNLKKKKPN
jgi:hypothetical protein